MSADRLVVAGGSLAGLRAVEAARKAGFVGSITLVGAEERLPYDRPPLSKAFLDRGPVGPVDPPYYRTEAELRDDLSVELRLGAPASGLDPARRVVQVGDRDVPYDALVIATGACPRTLPGTRELDGVFSLRTLDDALAIREALGTGARTVVIGAGFIGSEIASSAAKRGVEVTIVEAQETPLVRATGTQMGAALAALHERNGTTLRTGVGVRSIAGGRGRVEGVVLEDGTEIPADLVVVGVGVAPAVDWLEGSGLRLENGVVCDETLWTGVPGVYAAGDVATWPNPALDGMRQRMENWTAAAEMGAAAARNALDPGHAKAYQTVPYMWSDWYDVRIQFVGDAGADEVRLVDGDPRRDSRWVALYRKGDRLIGALTVQGHTEVMKYRRQIMQGGSWDDALAFAEQRREAHAKKVAARRADSA